MPKIVLLFVLNLNDKNAENIFCVTKKTVFFYLFIRERQFGVNASWLQNIPERKARSLADNLCWDRVEVLYCIIFNKKWCIMINVEFICVFSLVFGVFGHDDESNEVPWPLTQDPSYDPKGPNLRIDISYYFGGEIWTIRIKKKRCTVPQCSGSIFVYDVQVLYHCHSVIGCVYVTDWRTVLLSKHYAILLIFFLYGFVVFIIVARSSPKHLVHLLLHLLYTSKLVFYGKIVREWQNFLFSLLYTLHIYIIYIYNMDNMDGWMYVDISMCAWAYLYVCVCVFVGASVTMTLVWMNATQSKIILS